MGQEPSTSSKAVNAALNMAIDEAVLLHHLQGQVPPTLRVFRWSQPSISLGRFQQIEREIERTRDQLGETVEALARKADVKRQAKDKVEATKVSVAAKKEQLLGKAKDASPDGTSAAAAQVSRTARENPVPLAAVGAFLAGYVAGRITRR